MDEGSNPYQEEIGFGAARHLQERLLLLRRAALKLLVGVGKTGRIVLGGVQSATSAVLY
jgi:hypothetical protein